MIDMNEVTRKRADLLIAFASGPGMSVQPVEERLALYFELDSLLLHEVFGLDDENPPTPAQPVISERSQTATRIDWFNIIEELRQNPKATHNAPYRNPRIASATVSKMRERYPDVEFWSSRNDDGTADVCAKVKTRTRV